MAVSEKEFESIIRYVRQHLLDQLPNTYENDPIGAVPMSTILAISTDVVYEKWKEQYKPTRTKRVAEEDPQFKEFYYSYPVSNKFEYKGQQFNPVNKRGLRDNYETCQKKFQELVKSTHIPAEEYIKALKVHVESVKIESYKKMDNRMSFFPGMTVWLNNSRYYSTWIGEEMPVEEKTKIVNTMDI